MLYKCVYDFLFCCSFFDVLFDISFSWTVLRRQFRFCTLAEHRIEEVRSRGGATRSGLVARLLAEPSEWLSVRLQITLDSQTVWSWQIWSCVQALEISGVAQLLNVITYLSTHTIDVEFGGGVTPSPFSRPFRQIVINKKWHTASTSHIPRIFHTRTNWGYVAYGVI